MRRALVCVALVASSSCQLIRDYATYRELVAHEREFADVEITRLRIDVALEPASASATVAARATLHNAGDAELGRLRLLLAERAVLRSVHDEQGELEHETEIVASVDSSAPVH
jgi:hypothetical protein